MLFCQPLSGFQKTVSPRDGGPSLESQHLGGKRIRIQGHSSLYIKTEARLFQNSIITTAHTDNVHWPLLQGLFASRCTVASPRVTDPFVSGPFCQCQTYTVAHLQLSDLTDEPLLPHSQALAVHMASLCRDLKAPRRLKVLPLANFLFPFLLPSSFVSPPFKSPEYVCMCVCVWIWIWICMCVCVFACVSVCVCLWVCMGVWGCTRVQVLQEAREGSFGGGIKVMAGHLS